MAALTISLAAETIATFHGIPITNSMLASAIATVIILIVFITAGKTTQLHPKSSLANAIETLVDGALDVIDSITGSPTISQQLFPFVMTFFIYILFNNWLGLFPGISAITIGSTPLLRTGTADLNTTVALAIISVITTQAYAIHQLGIWNHIKKYVSWNPMMMFVGLLEAVSELTRLVSFSFRLFGSVFAGEVLLLVIGYFLPLVGPLPFMLLEVLFGLVQAVVFAMLTLVFMKLAITDQHSSHQVEASH